MAPSSPRIAPLVIIPILLSWLVTAARVAGELCGLGPPWVSSAPGGGNAILGIVWLVPLCGAWFGWRLAGAAPPDRPGRALALHLAALGLYVGGFQVVRFVLCFDTSTASGLTAQILAMGAVSVLVLPFAKAAWPQLFTRNLSYALAVRVPIAALTFLAVFGAWGTHLEKFGPRDYQGFGPWPHGALLAFTQLVFWPSFTIVCGGLFGSLAALAARRVHARAATPARE
jgi:hypothetical protein